MGQLGVREGKDGARTGPLALALPSNPKIDSRDLGAPPAEMSQNLSSTLPGPGPCVCKNSRSKGTVWVTRNNVLPQSVLGALIAVNLKNSLKQLADPYYLWRRSKLDCVGTGWPPSTHPCPCLSPSPMACQFFLGGGGRSCCSAAP